MRRILLVLLVSLLPGLARAEERSVNVYNWTDYIDPGALKRFTRETGIVVHYDVYDSLETLEAKLSTGHSGYDVVVPTSEPTFARLVREGALMPLDRSAIPHAAGLDASLMARVSSADPGNMHGVIYLWGTIGLGENRARLDQLAPNAPLDSWDVLFRPEWARRIAACGITLLDSATDVIPTVLRYLKRDPNSVAPDDLAAAQATLLAIRPYVRTLESGGAINALADGSTCLALSYSGDVIQARARAEEAKRGVTVRYVAPAEGAQLWFDMLAVPADAPHTAEALLLIDFLLRPDVMAGITNTVRYPNAIPASQSLVDMSIRSDADIYPRATDPRFFTIHAVPVTAERARTRVWSRFKAGG